MCTYVLSFLDFLHILVTTEELSPVPCAIG